MADERPRNNSTSLRRALGVLRFVAEQESPADLSLIEVAAGADLPLSTLRRLIEPLLDAGLLRQDRRTGRLSLGPYTAFLGYRYLADLDVRIAGRPILEGLVERTGETAHLVICDQAEAVYIEKIDSPSPVRMHSRVGRRAPLYCTAAGKAILAYSGADLLNSVVAAGLYARTASTIVEAEGLRAELRSVLARGYAVDDGEGEDGVRCVAAPVFDQTGEVAAAISVSAPATRLPKSKIAALANNVQMAARELSGVLGRTGTRPPADA